MTEEDDKTLHTIIVGAGQAGLCASYHLSQRGIDHLILERARVGERLAHRALGFAAISVSQSLRTSARVSLRRQ